MTTQDNTTSTQVIAETEIIDEVHLDSDKEDFGSKPGFYLYGSTDGKIVTNFFIKKHIRKDESGKEKDKGHRLVVEMTKDGWKSKSAVFLEMIDAMAILHLLYGKINQMEVKRKVTGKEGAYKNFKMVHQGKQIYITFSQTGGTFLTGKVSKPDMYLLSELVLSAIILFLKDKNIETTKETFLREFELINRGILEGQKAYDEAEAAKKPQA